MTNSKNSEEKTIKKNKVLNYKMAHKRNLEKSTRVDEENKNRTTGILCKLCVTLQIYLELKKSNWIMKFKPMKVQDLISTIALESYKNIAPINCDNFCKITATLPYFLCQNYTLDIFDLSFFLFQILTYLFSSTFL